MSDLLQTIKDQVAVELGYATFRNFKISALPSEVDKLVTEVCKRYAKEVAKASLKKASESAKRFRNKDMEYEVDRTSINDESNIVL